MMDSNNCLTHKRRKFLKIFAGATIGVSIISIKNIKIVIAQSFSGGFGNPLFSFTINLLVNGALKLATLWVTSQFRSASLKQDKQGIALNFQTFNKYSSAASLSFTICITGKTPIQINDVIMPGAYYSFEYMHYSEGDNTPHYLWIVSSGSKSPTVKIPSY